MKKFLKFLAIVLAVILLLVAGLVLFLTVTEYRPPARSRADEYTMSTGDDPQVDPNTPVTIYIWNTGYAGLGEESDFFMDGGAMVYPPDQETVKKNLDAITEFISTQDADAWLLQEVDTNSARTGHYNQYLHYTRETEAGYGKCTFAYNYKCPFVPIPFPPMGQINSGIATLTDFQTSDDGERISLPCPFSWPVRAANIKRCLLVNRLPVDGSDKEVVLVNLHLEAYDSGEGKIAQFKQLMDLMVEEYEKGNYVIAGGDFNQSFPGVLEQYPIEDPDLWMPGLLEEDALPEGWQYAFDPSVPTCRLLSRPYDQDVQKYVIDGFILSPNVELSQVETIDLDFAHSDHNPVRLEATLIP